MENIQKIKIRCEPSVGNCLSTSIKIGTRSHEFALPNLDDLIKWLESICLGAEECSYNFMENGTSCIFTFTKINNTTGSLQLYRGCIIEISKVQVYDLVHEFYSSLANYSFPEKDTSEDDSDSHSMLADLIEILEISKEQLLDKLASFSYEELIFVFDRYSTLLNTRKTLNQHNNDELPNPKNIKLSCLVDVPPEYQDLKYTDRIAYLQENLSKSYTYKTPLPTNPSSIGNWLQKNAPLCMN